MKNEMYIIMDAKTCSLITRASSFSSCTAIRFGEVKHDENGNTCMIDVLEAIGYTIDGYEYATAKKTSPMGRDRHYNLNDLKMIVVDCDTGSVH